MFSFRFRTRVQPIGNVPRYMGNRGVLMSANTGNMGANRGLSMIGRLKYNAPCNCR
jgi:hypothetical protein